MFLYESIWNLLIMGFLLIIGRKFKDKLYRGDIFLGYLVLYPVGRFLLEFIRLDPSNVGGMNVNQTIMAVIAISAIILLLLKRTVLKDKQSFEPYPELAPKAS
jgi:phosphatidylglycerol:prolipoprotein diacylglycerol transferase